MIEIPQRSRALLQTQQSIINAMIEAIRATLDVPDGFTITADGTAFIPPQTTSQPTLQQPTNGGEQQNGNTHSQAGTRATISNQ